MKKLFVVLAVASMFIAGTAFGALYNVAPQYIPPANFGGFDFDLQYNAGTDMITVGMPINATPTAIANGMWSTSFSFAVTDPDANGIVESIPNWTTFPGAANGLTSFVGYIMGGGYLSLFNWDYDTINGGGQFALCPYWSPTHMPPPEGAGGFHYTSAVPVPAAVWLLGSGMVLLVFSRKKRKSC